MFGALAVTQPESMSFEVTPWLPDMSPFASIGFSTFPGHSESALKKQQLQTTAG
jgi:hypothetical protein